MGKNAVYNPSRTPNIVDDFHLKRIALLFDHIYIHKWKIKQFTSQDMFELKIPDDLWSKISQENDLYDYLIGAGIVMPYENEIGKASGPLQETKKMLINEALAILNNLGDFRRKLESAKTSEEITNISKHAEYNASVSSDIHARLDSIVLSEVYEDEFYPVLKSAKSFHDEGKKTKVIQFILNCIPEPTINTTWEQIIDFRNDEATRLKYLELINWINQISYSTLTVNEIKEKYEFLYLEYKRSIEKHKIKFALGTLEVLTAVGIGFLNSNLPSAIKVISDICKVGLSTLSLVSEEGRLPGKEIAYIYHANRKIS